MTQTIHGLEYLAVSYTSRKKDARKSCVTDFKGIKKTDEICVQEKLTVVFLEYKNFEVFERFGVVL